VIFNAFSGVMISLLTVGSFTVIDIDWVSFPTEFDTLTVKVFVPAAIGVPLMTPSEERLSPAGSEPSDIDHVNGDVPVAEKAK